MSWFDRPNHLLIHGKSHIYQFFIFLLKFKNLVTLQFTVYPLNCFSTKISGFSSLLKKCEHTMSHQAISFQLIVWDHLNLKTLKFCSVLWTCSLLLFSSLLTFLLTALFWQMSVHATSRFCWRPCFGVYLSVLHHVLYIFLYWYILLYMGYIGVNIGIYGYLWVYTGVNIGMSSYIWVFIGIYGGIY